MHLEERQALSKLGFFGKETDILLFLFRRKTATAHDIARQYSLPFDQAVTLLNGLCSSGILERRNKGEIYEICGEDRFSGWVSEQAQKSLENYQGANDTLRRFRHEIEENGWRPDMSYYEGKKGKTKRV